ncbi:MAG: DUF6036 family nucleotidyltransferase [Candidatus Njordarchaeota archaeon]
MTNFRDFLIRALKALEESGVPYALTGAVAAIYYGDIFTTRDVDFVVLIDFPGDAEKLYDVLSKYSFKCRDKKEFRRKILWKKVARCYDTKTMYYVDIIGAFTLTEQKSVELRVRAKIFGINCWITSPEPLIISKLQRMSGRDIEHIVSILRNRKNKLDWELLEELAIKEKVKGRLDIIIKKLNDLSI